LKISHLFDQFRKLTEVLNKILKQRIPKIPEFIEVYPLGIRLNIRVSGGESFYLMISPEKSFVKKGASAVDLNLEASENFWQDALKGEYSIISGMMEGKVKVRGLRSSFFPLIIFSSILSLFSNSLR